MPELSICAGASVGEDWILMERRNAGVVERGRLEICCPACRDRGFESLFLRQTLKRPATAGFLLNNRLSYA